MDHSTVIAVAGAKGGVGKTTSSINLGVALRERGLDVVVVELDLAMANVVDFLSLPFDEDADPTMHDVLAGEVPVTDVLVTAPGDVAVAPSGIALDGLDEIDITRLPAVLTALAEQFDVVVIDTAAGMNSATTAAVGAADRTILVSTPRVASLRDADKTQTLVEQADGDVAGLLLTKGGPGTAPESRRLADFLEVDLLATIPESSSVPASQDAGAPIVERRPDDPVTEAYREAAATLADGLDLTPGEADHEPSEDEQRNDETTTEGPSKADLEAAGWTFPGANEEGDRSGEDAAEDGETGAIESPADADDERTDERAVDRDVIDEDDTDGEQTEDVPDLIGRAAAAIRADTAEAADDGDERRERGADEQSGRRADGDRDRVFEPDDARTNGEPDLTADGSEVDDSNETDGPHRTSSEGGTGEAAESTADESDEGDAGGERSADDGDEEETESISGRLSSLLRFSE